MNYRAFFLLLAAVAPLGAQQGKRPLQLDDYYRIRELSNPELSPDGRWVAFTIGTRIEATNGTDHEVWLVPTDATSAAKRVSTTGVDATAPSWAKDGRLRFTVGRRQLIVDPATPDQPDSTQSDSTRGRVTTLYSADGKWMAGVRDVPVAKRVHGAQTEFEKRAEEHFKGVQFDYWPFMGDGRAFPLPNKNDPEVNPPQEVFVARANGIVAAQEKDLRAVTRLGLRPVSLEWSPDNTTLAFIADSNYRKERTYARTELYTVTVDGTVKRLTPNAQYDYAGAKYSPDGKWILTTRGLADDYVIGKKLTYGGATDLVLVPAGGGAEINLTKDWDYLPAQAFWSKDGSFVYFTGGVGGTNHLFRVSGSGGPVQQVTLGERRLAGFSFDTAQTRVAYSVGVMDSPAEIFVSGMDGKGETQLTHVHDAFTSEVGASRTERLQYKSKDGTPIEGWLVFPAGYKADHKYPLVVASHGGPHAADGYGYNFKNQYLAANGYFVLFVNFRSSTGYGEKFLWGTWGAWGTKDGQDVMSGVDLVLAKYPIDRSRVAAMGHSYGGFMTNWLITQYPDRFVAAVPGAGIVNWMSDYGNADIPITKEKEFGGGPWSPAARATMLRQSPLVYADKVKAATLFIIGEIDQRVPYSETQQFYTALKKNGVPAKVIRYAGMPHAISGHWNQVHRVMNETAWLNEWVKGRGLTP
ncbi:MAG: S9 family peptidase [bacterium]